MPAHNYPVTNPYRPGIHNGLDRAMPSGTPIQAGGTAIGLSGNTGFSTGPHLHTQAGYDFYAQEMIDPSPHEFKGGEVVQTGTASQWGNYIIIKTGSVFVVYAHLSKILVTVGQQTGVKTMDREYVEIMFTNLLGRAPKESDYKAWVGQDSEKMFRELTVTDTWNTRAFWANNGKKLLKESEDEIAHLEREIASLKAQTGDSTKWDTLKALIRELTGR